MILYEGPSRLDGEPIVAIATGLDRPSANSKTGHMIQTWILRSDQHPSMAVRSGADVSVCGTCPHRSAASGGWGSCYVRVPQAPAGVWRAYERGSYARATTPRERREIGRGRLIRLGAYGDPGAVPLAVWRDLLRYASGWTGYTHAWRSRPGLRTYLMASVDSPEEGRDARARGWRTFRVTPRDGAPGPGEISCPAEAGLTTCDRCQLCRGTSVRARSITIRAHGATAGRAQLG